MATRAAAMMVHCVFEGSLSMSEVDKERRPYIKTAAVHCIGRKMNPQELVSITQEYHLPRNSHGALVVHYPQLIPQTPFNLLVDVINIHKNGFLIKILFWNRVCI